MPAFWAQSALHPILLTRPSFPFEDLVLRLGFYDHKQDFFLLSHSSTVMTSLMNSTSQSDGCDSYMSKSWEVACAIVQTKQNTHSTTETVQGLGVAQQHYLRSRSWIVSVSEPKPTPVQISSVLYWKRYTRQMRSGDETRSWTTEQYHLAMGSVR